MKAISWLFILLIILSEGCMPFLHEAKRRIPFHTLSEPGQWTVGDQPAYIVVTEGNWSTYYSSPPSGSDFRRFIYIVVSLGIKPNVGYTVRIRQIKRAKDIITVKVELKEPDPAKTYAQIIVYPTTVVKIAKTDLKPCGLFDFVFIDQKGQRLTTLPFLLNGF